MLSDIHVSLDNIVFTLFRFLLTIGLVLHILLYKRNTSSAIGWIGICVIVPYLGAILYFIFGINRVTRRARKLIAHELNANELIDTQKNISFTPSQITHYETSDQHFASLMHMVETLTSRPIMGDNTIIGLHDGDEAYPLMLHAIESAKKSVFLCSYIFKNDHIGGIFANKLMAAHCRGVQVRVLVDGIGSGYFLSPIYYYLKSAGVPCARFMHSLYPWKMPFLNLRNHRKSLMVDGHIGFIGGLNIADENMLTRHPKEPVSDTHFRVIGPVVGQLVTAFAQDWYFTTHEILSIEPFMPQNNLKTLASDDTQNGTFARIVTAGPDTDLEKIEYVMLQAITLARKSVQLMTPYFLADDRFLTELELAALRGVDVTIIIPLKSNHRVLDWACRTHVSSLLRSHVQIWLSNPPFNHSKLMVVDKMWSFVGSSNLDMRSLRLNFEMNMEVYDSSLAEALSNFMERHKNHPLTQADLDNRSYSAKIPDSLARLFMPYL
ncbi:MAG: cardiolipin synthase [Acetobacter sp.]|nr:cardiolipin synthase [Acetobacter sp.]